MEGILKISNKLEWHPSTWFYQVVKLITGSRWNHAVVVVDLENERMVVEAVGYGVVMTNYDIWLTRRKRKIEFIPRKVNKELLLKQIGSEYDKGRFLFTLPVYLITGKWIGKPDDRKRFYCSEFAEAVTENKTFPIFPKDFKSDF
jgi:hypothetical protein